MLLFCVNPFLPGSAYLNESQSIKVFGHLWAHGVHGVHPPKFVGSPCQHSRRGAGDERRKEYRVPRSHIHWMVLATPPAEVGQNPSSTILVGYSCRVLVQVTGYLCRHPGM